MYLLAFTIAFASYVQSEQKAEAFAWAGLIPAGITVGAGTYVVGALALAGMVGLVGYDEHGEAIKAHSQQVWKDGTQTAIDSLNVSIELAKDAGNGLVKLQTDYINFMEGKLQSIAASNATIIAGGVPVSKNQDVKFEYISNPFVLQIKTAAELDTTSPDRFMYYNSTNGLQYYPAVIAFEALGSNTIKAFNIKKTITLQQYQEVTNSIQNSPSYGTMMNLLTRHYPEIVFTSAVVQQPQMEEIYNNGLSKIREAWTSMKDAGLVLPVDSAVPINSETGDPLTYNPDADTYTGIDGGVYTGVPSWLFPQPKIRTGNPDIPDGVYVDTPVITGNPAYDTPILENPAIPKTTTNINTGITTANPDIPLTPTPTPTPTPEPTPTPKPLPRIPNSAAPVPALVLLAFFDLLRALLMYLVRMFNWIMTIPFIDEKPIDNPMYQWFRQAKILGVYPYSLVTAMATFFLGFKLVKAVRSFLP